MSVFEHKYFGNPQDICDNPHSRNCIYCKEKLSTVPIENASWKTTDEELLTVHEETRIQYKEIHNLEDCYLNLNLDSKDEEVWIDYCTTCGWWRLVKDVCVWAETWQIWDIFFGCSGVLKNLQVDDLNTPIDEIANYLTARYNSRFSVHPRLFEAVVGSVCKAMGYQVHVTGYTNDGGIDVVLENSSMGSIGIQVKRYKNKIRVEQIRAFAGALLLSGHKRGIFVTTSDFQPGAYLAAGRYSIQTIPIELINAERFYDALKLTQKPTVDTSVIIESAQNTLNILFPYGCDTPRNSL